MKPKVWSGSGILIIYGAALDVQQHQHNAIQLVWPASHCQVELADTCLNQAVIINAHVSHKLSMEAGWIILIEPQSFLGQSLKLQFLKSDFKVLTDLPAFNSSQTSMPSKIPIELLTPLWQTLQLEPEINSFTENNSNPSLDPRIHQLQTRLNECFNGSCLKPQEWRASQVAADLSLSTSRFLHLFKQEMGIAWRPFLLWRRLLCAVNIINNGGTATLAAHTAGFSDSSHLSRSFRNMFGLSIRQATKIFN